MIFSQNNIPRMKVYLPEGAIPSQQTASAELKKYLDRISGGFFQVTGQFSSPSVILACKGLPVDFTLIRRNVDPKHRIFFRCSVQEDDAVIN